MSDEGDGNEVSHDEGAVEALRDRLTNALTARGRHVPTPRARVGTDLTFPASTVMDWTCASLLAQAGAFLEAAILADANGDSYHAEQYTAAAGAFHDDTEQGNQYYHAGSAFWDAYRGQCS